MYHRSILRRSHVALSLCGIALAAVVVSFAFAALQLGRDASTPAELERVFLEVEAMQDEDVQLTNELRISEETDPPDGHMHIARHVKLLGPFAVAAPDDAMAKGLHLVTTYFRQGASPEHTKEVVKGIVKNLDNDAIAMVHVLYDGETPPDLVKWQETAPHKQKLLLVKTHSMPPTYSELLAYANTRLKRGAVAILASADMYFDSALACIKPVSPESSRFQITFRQAKRPFFALTRRHAPECGAKPDYKNVFDLCDNYIGSHDAFVFAVPVADEIVREVNHTQYSGLGAENVLVWELNHSGEWRGFNPCDLVGAYHLHCSVDRSYSVLGKDSRLIFVSRKGFNGARQRRHGIVKPWHLRKTIACPFEMY